MVKEYWKQNRKDYIIFGVLIFLVTILSFIFSRSTEINGAFSVLSSSLPSEVVFERSNQEWIFLIIIVYLIGFLSFAVFGYQIYICLKPFIKKQVQQTISIGNNPVNYLLVHVAFLIAMALLEVLTLYISDLIFFIQQGNQILAILKLIISQIALPLWLLAIPVTIMNGKILNDVAPRKRSIMIIASYLILWGLISIIQVIPSLQEVFVTSTQILNNTSGNIEVIKSSQVASISLLVDFVGVAVFILAFNSFKKNYEIII